MFQFIYLYFTLRFTHASLAQPEQPPAKNGPSNV